MWGAVLVALAPPEGGPRARLRRQMACRWRFEVRKGREGGWGEGGGGGPVFVELLLLGGVHLAPAYADR